MGDGASKQGDCPSQTLPSGQAAFPPLSISGSGACTRGPNLEKSTRQGQAVRGCDPLSGVSSVPPSHEAPSCLNPVVSKIRRNLAYLGTALLCGWLYYVPDPCCPSQPPQVGTTVIPFSQIRKLGCQSAASGPPRQEVGTARGVTTSHCGFLMLDRQYLSLQALQFVLCLCTLLRFQGFVILSASQSFKIYSCLSFQVFYFSYY